MKKIISKSKEETQKLAGELLNDLGERRLVLLQGGLGAGKTTFAQGFLRAIGAKGPFTSPTFVVMKKYELGKNKIKKIKSIYHLDCYRVEVQDILEMGWKEIVRNKSSLTLVEWPENISSILPAKYVKVKLKNINKNERRIEVTKN
jgi:tRNA threonylcarbamoyladenosine biosynthesis protein TsaE